MMQVADTGADVARARRAQRRWRAPPPHGGVRRHASRSRLLEDPAEVTRKGRAKAVAKPAVDREYLQQLEQGDLDKVRSDIQPFKPPAAPRVMRERKAAFFASLDWLQRAKAAREHELGLPPKERVLFCSPEHDVTNPGAQPSRGLSDRYDLAGLAKCPYCPVLEAAARPSWCPFHGKATARDKAKQRRPKIPTYPPLPRERPRAPHSRVETAWS